jgi:hypothetical protein
VGREGWRILIDELGGGTTVAAAGQLVVVEGVESVEVRWGAEGGKGVTGKLEKKGWGGGTTRKEGSRVPICDLCNANRLREATTQHLLADCPSICACIPWALPLSIFLSSW